MPPLDRKTLKQRTIVYLEECFRRESPPRISELADQLQMKPWLLSRLAKKLLGLPLREYLAREQVKRAKRMLRDSQASLNRIAYACAFGTRNTFFRVFHQRVGMTPDEFRRRKK